MALDVSTLYERHAPEIHDFLARTVHDHAVAEDLTQTTFIRLIERGDSVREAEKLRPWLFTVAHNLAVTHVTRRPPADPIEAAFAIASGDKGPEEEALAADAARLVWDAARSLEPRQYAVLDLTVRRGFTVGEIAEVLEITPAHAAVVVHRAREALAQAIRLLVVVRQRRHCARLAELIPPGTEVLTPDLRATADRHMRRCEVCKEVGQKLTDPVELLSVLPLLPLPLALHHAPLMPAATAHVAHAAAARASTHLQGAAQRITHLLGQPAVLAGLAAVAIAGAGVGVGMALHGGSHHGSPAVGRVEGGPAKGGTDVVVPPLTGGPGQTVGDAHRASLAAQDNVRYGTDVVLPTVDAPVAPPSPTSAPSPKPPPPPPPPPAPALHLFVPVGNGGIDVVVYSNPTTNPPVVTITPPTLPVPAHSAIRNL